MKIATSSSPSLVLVCLTALASSAFGFTTRLPTFGTPTAHQRPAKQHSVICTPTFNDRRKLLPPLFLSWGPEPTWSNAKVESVTPASSNSVSVTLSVPSDVAEGFAVPGQYVQLKPSEDAKPLFLAVASSPDPSNPTFEFLIKKTDNNDWITSPSAAGVSCLTSQIMGGGFPIAENIDGFKYDFPTQNVIMFATGSGIAPIRSVIEANAPWARSPSEW